MRHSPRLGAVLYCTACLVLFVGFVCLIPRHEPDPLEIGKAVEITLNHKRGTVIEHATGRVVVVNYVDGRGDVTTTRVLRSQLKPLEE